MNLPKNPGLIAVEAPPEDPLLDDCAFGSVMPP